VAVLSTDTTSYTCPPRAADERSDRAGSVHPLAVAAAKVAGLHDFVMALPRRYKTVLQPRGAASGHFELNNAQEGLLALARKNYKVRAKHAAVRHTDAVWQRTGSDSPKAGVVPDFDALHAQWEAQLAAARGKARTRTEATAPQV
jgi:hypothetical protein